MAQAQKATNLVINENRDCFNYSYKQYAPQVNRPQEEKDAFLEELEDMVQAVPDNEMICIDGDFNAHIGETCRNYQGVHGQKGYGTVNEEGERLLETCEALELYITNTGFKKKYEQRVTYRSGGHDTQIDFLLVRKETE